MASGGPGLPDEPVLGALTSLRLDELIADRTQDGVLVSGGDRDVLELAGARLFDSRLEQVVAGESVDLSDSRLGECIVAEIRAPSVRAVRAAWRGTFWTACRVGSFEAYESELVAVGFRGCKFDYVNLRHATIRGLLFENCQIGELDLGQADVAGAWIVDSRVGGLDLTAATLSRVDIARAEVEMLRGLSSARGLTISDRQAQDLLPAFAEELGIEISPVE
jgi:uncharacterized protein YjbI with pentapeptide repeats